MQTKSDKSIIKNKKKHKEISKNKKKKKNKQLIKPKNTRLVQENSRTKLRFLTNMEQN